MTARAISLTRTTKAAKEYVIHLQVFTEVKVPVRSAQQGRCLKQLETLACARPAHAWRTQRGPEKSSTSPVQSSSMDTSLSRFCRFFTVSMRFEQVDCNDCLMHRNTEQVSPALDFGQRVICSAADAIDW